MPTPSPEKTGQEQDRNGKGRFKRGQSGNPAGRPRGARNKTTLAAEQLLDQQADALTQRAVDLALAGDLTALKLCLDRVVPVRKSRLISVDLPPVTKAGDLPDLTARLLNAVSAGELSPGDAAEIGRLADSHRAAVELADIEQRLAALEAAERAHGK